MSTPATSRTTVMLPLDAIDRPALDARIDRDPEKLEELARDILRRGLIEPIKVFAKGDRYEVVDGFRRYLATKHAGVQQIECFVFPTYDAAHEGVKYAANAFREDMSPAEEAVLFNQLLHHECGDDIERLCALINKKIAYVDNRLALLAGDELVFEALKDRKIPIGVAQELNKIPAADYRRYYLEHAIRGGSTVAVVSGWVQEWKSMYGTERPAAPAAPEPGVQAAAAALDIYYCEVCRKSDPRYIPLQIQVHAHCKLAVLDPLLESYHGSTGNT